MATPGSIHVFLVTNFMGRLFLSLGSKPALLSWDVDAGTVTISTANREGSSYETLVSIPASQIERAYFMHGSYTLYSNGRRYIMQVRMSTKHSALVQDVIEAAVGTIAEADANASTDVQQLVDFITERAGKRVVTSSIISSNRYVWFVIGGVVLASIVIALIALFV